MTLPRSRNDCYENSDGTVEWVVMKEGVPVRSVTTDVQANEMAINWEQLSIDPATWSAVHA